MLDLGKLQRAVNREFTSETAFKQWFSLLLHYSLVDTATGNYHPFGQIGDAALDMLAQALGEPARPAARKKELLALLTELPPPPTSFPASRPCKSGFPPGHAHQLARCHGAETDGLRRPDRLF